MTTRKITLSAAALLMVAALAGCSGNTTSASSNSSSAAEAGSSAADTSAADSSAADSTASDSTASKLDTDITVVSREDGSGTRGAFVELMGIEQKNEAGEKEDMTRGDAEISRLHQRRYDERSRQCRRDRLHLPRLPQRHRKLST